MRCQPWSGPIWRGKIKVTKKEAPKVVAQIAKSHLRARFVEKLVSTMRRWKLLPETRLAYRARNASATSCSGRQLQEDQSGRARKRHKRQHLTNAQTAAKKKHRQQLSDHLPGKTKQKKKHSGNPIGKTKPKKKTTFGRPPGKQNLPKNEK